MRSWAILDICLLTFLLLSAAVTTISARCRVEEAEAEAEDDIDMMMMTSVDGGGGGGQSLILMVLAGSVADCVCTLRNCLLSL